jgi:hypothetical protein
MAGIYIERMSMPHEDELIVITSDGMALLIDKEFTMLERSKVIPVPDHGRLIDADEYQAKMRNAYDDDWFTVLEAAPTVIPADPADKEDFK